MSFRNITLLLFILPVINTQTLAQNVRTQYPSLLKNSYFGVNIGYINYPFSGKQLEPGFDAGPVKVPHTAVRINLLGYRFTDYLSAEISYTRPVLWVRYYNINGTAENRPVHMNMGGLTLRAKAPLHKNFSLTGEGGLGLITRKGFKINDETIVKDASYAGFLLGGSLNYHRGKKWDFALTSAYSPQNKKHRQPATTFYSLGFNYHMQPLPAEKAKANAKSGYIFPANLLQVGYTTNGLGYGVNSRPLKSY